MTLSSDNLNVICCQWATHNTLIKPIREQVFIEEQHVPLDLEWDGEDESAWHFLATLGDQPVGTARLLSSGQIGRMSVLKPYRRLGVGESLLLKAEETAKQQGLKQVFLHAQTYIQQFYQSHGFQPRGDIFMDAGIPHIEMLKKY